MLSILFLKGFSTEFLPIKVLEKSQEEYVPETVKAEEIDAVSQKVIEEIETIHIISIFAQDICENLKTLLPRIENINKNFEELPVFLQGQNQGKVPQILTEFADIFDNLCHLISLTALFPDYFDKITVEENRLTDFIKEFSPFLIDFEDSIKNNDTVTICDIAEYEIKPRFISLANTLKEL